MDGNAAMKRSDIIAGHIYGNFGTDMRRVVALREERSVFDFEPPTTHVDFITIACSKRKTHLLPWEHDQGEPGSLPLFEFAAWAMRRFSDHDAASRAVDLRATRFRPTRAQKQMLIDAILAGPAGQDGGTPFTLHPARQRVAAGLVELGMLTSMTAAGAPITGAKLTIYGVLVADLVCKRNGVRSPHALDLPNARQALVDHLDMPTAPDHLQPQRPMVDIPAPVDVVPVCARHAPPVFDGLPMEMASPVLSPF